MKTVTRILTTTAAMVVWGTGLMAATAEVGKVAPDFTLTDIQGSNHTLSDLKGKTVVLEWVNPECPFVKKHYDESGNIPKTQKSATAEGVVWYTINSASPGQSGDYNATRVSGWLAKNGAGTTAYLQDHDGKVGRLYDARTTPHLYVIDDKGILVYAGGIDSIRSAKVADISKATNYVTEALADVKAGKPVRTPTSQPYGCAIKY